MGFSDFSRTKRHHFVSSSVMKGMKIEVPEHLLTELVREFLFHLFNLASFAVVPKSSGHFLVGHLLAIAFLLPPVRCQSFFVLCGELENALVLVHPPDTVTHVSIFKQVQEELIQADFSFIWNEKLVVFLSIYSQFWWL